MANEQYSNSELYEQKLNMLRKNTIGYIEKLCDLCGAKLSLEEIEKYVNVELMPALKAHATKQNADVQGLMALSEPLKSFIMSVYNSQDPIENKLQSVLALVEKAKATKTSFAQKADDLSFKDTYSQFYRKIVIASGMGYNENFTQDFLMFLRHQREDIETFFKNNNNEHVNAFFNEFGKSVENFTKLVTSSSIGEATSEMEVVAPAKK